MGDNKRNIVINETAAKANKRSVDLITSALGRINENISQDGIQFKSAFKYDERIGKIVSDLDLLNDKTDKNNATLVQTIKSLEHRHKKLAVSCKRSWEYLNNLIDSKGDNRIQCNHD